MHKLLIAVGLVLLTATGCGKSEDELRQDAIDVCTSSVEAQVPNNGYQVRFDDSTGDPQATRSGDHWIVTGRYWGRGPGPMKTGSFRCDVASPTEVTADVTPDAP